MKKLYLFTMVLAAGMLLAACGQGKLPQIDFDGQAYRLAFSTRQPAGRINEYLRPGESLDKYSRMIGVYTFPGLKDKTPQEALQMLSAYMMSSNPMVSYEMHESKDKNAAIIDFLVFSPGVTMAEYNVFKYVKDGDEMKSLQFVARWYATNGKDAVENARNFATSYLENRQEWVKKVDEMRFPKVYEQDYSIDPSLYVEEDSAQEQSAPAPNQTPAPTEPDTPQQTEK